MLNLKIQKFFKIKSDDFPYKKIKSQFFLFKIWKKEIRTIKNNLLPSCIPFSENSQNVNVF